MKRIENDNDKAYSKEEARIIEMLIEHGINPMAAPNCATEIIDYVNVFYKEDENCKHDLITCGTRAVECVKCGGLFKVDQSTIERVDDDWISVEDRLPKKGERVMLFCNSQGAQLCYLDVKNKWRSAFNMSEVFLNITHWQPLPKSPKK